MTLQAIDRDLWVIDHPLTMGGLALGTRTTVVRLADGGVVLFGPGPLDDAAAAALAALGPVHAIVAPNLLHHLSLGAACARFPQARLHAPAGLIRKQPSLTIAGPPEALPSQGALRAIPVGGMPKLEETLFVHVPSRTLIATDFAFNLRPPAPWFTRLFMRINGGFDRFGPTRIFRTMVKDRAAVRAGVERLLAEDFDRVIVSHGQLLASDGPAALRAGFSWLLS
jgi:hypothetical protein